MKKKVRLISFVDIEHFVTEMNCFSADVDLYFGHQSFDAKSFMAMANLEPGKTYEVEINTDNEETKELFNKIIDSFNED